MALPRTEIRSAEIAFLRELIGEHPELSRWALSKKVCEAWQWKQANGELRDMVCRGLLLMLERAGAIQLPPARGGSPNRPEGPERPEPLVPDNRPVRGPLGELGVLEFQQVRRTPQEALFNSLLEQYHYLRYQQPVGEHLKYLVSAKGQVIACLAWCSAPRHLASRDRFIGWSAEARQRNLRLLAYNTRFLILPWVLCRTWLRTFSAAWRKSCRAIGNRCMRIRCIGWRPSSTRHVSKAPAIARPTGSVWEAPQAVGTTRGQRNAHSR